MPVTRCEFLLVKKPLSVGWAAVIQRRERAEGRWGQRCLHDGGVRRMGAPSSALAEAAPSVLPGEILHRRNFIMWRQGNALPASRLPGKVARSQPPLHLQTLLPPGPGATTRVEQRSTQAEEPRRAVPWCHSTGTARA